MQVSRGHRPSVRERCGQVFRAFGADRSFPFCLSADSSAGDLHLNYDRYGISLITVLNEARGVRDEDLREFWPFLGQGGVTEPLYIPVNKTTEVKVCTADVIHS